MEPTSYVRNCPRCDTSFTAVSERGVCPGCKLFFRRKRDGNLVGIVPTFVTPSQFDWPFEPLDELGAAIFETFAIGGGPVFVSDRHDQYPDVDLVHKQLIEMFHAIIRSIKPHIPESALYGLDVDTLPTCYSDAIECNIVAWDHDGKHYQLVCYLTHEGGSIDAILERNALDRPF